METFLGIILGGGFLAFLQFLITRYDKKHDRFAEFERQLKELVLRMDKSEEKDNKRDKEIELIATRINSIQIQTKAIEDKGDSREAENRRVRILRFEDELQRGKKHTKDSFDQVMVDIKQYNLYCEAHPEFENGKTGPTAIHIEKVYQERLDKKDWLPNGYSEEED